MSRKVAAAPTFKSSTPSELTPKSLYKILLYGLLATPISKNTRAQATIVGIVTASNFL